MTLADAPVDRGVGSDAGDCREIRNAETPNLWFIGCDPGVKITLSYSNEPNGVSPDVAE
jgi:hypothetical protein